MTVTVTAVVPGLLMPNLGTNGEQTAAPLPLRTLCGMASTRLILTDNDPRGK